MKREEIRRLFFSLGILFCLVVLSWGKAGANNRNLYDPYPCLPVWQETDEDTIPREKIEQHLQKSMKQVEEAMQRLEQQLSRRNFSKEVEEALNRVDLAKIKRDVDAAIARIDLTKVTADIEAAVSHLDMKHLSEDLKKAMHDARRHFNSEEWKSQMKELRNVDMKELEEQMKKLKQEMKGLNLDASLETARKALEKVKLELAAYTEMTNEMERDGLINKKKGFKIERKNGELWINGQKQNAKVTEKYSQYLKQKPDFKLNSDFGEREGNREE